MEIVGLLKLLLTLLTKVTSVKSIFISLAIAAYFNVIGVHSRKHHLEVQDDARPYIALSTFGFYTNGHLNVKLSNLLISEETGDELLGLSLDKTIIDEMNPYLDSHQNKCLLEKLAVTQHNGPILFFVFDLKNLQVHVKCSPEWRNSHIYKNSSMFPMYRGKRQSAHVVDSTLFMEPRRRRKRHVEPIDSKHGNAAASTTGMILDDSSYDVSRESAKSQPSVGQQPKHNEVAGNQGTEHKSVATFTENKKELTTSKETGVKVADYKPTITMAAPDVVSSNDNTPNAPCNNFKLPLTKTNINGINYYNMSFSMFVANIHEEGLYNLYFHDCPNYHGANKQVSFAVDIEENNNGNYLSAGEMPLPALYLMMSLLFFLSGLFWVFILKKSKHTVYKIHYIMAILVFLKSLSLMFHSINYHFIEIRGEHVEAWAILYYIAHLLKGAVLFITIVLIGSGWTFIKHILSDKDKKIFMVVIPLQVLANVAEIIIEESEESDAEFRTWHSIFIFVDMLCCGFILFPIVWSIRHLHEASATDGKAAINLRKLKLFRQFYIMIVCYIYFTRIVVYLLKMTMTFQYGWLDEMFREMATYVFFVLTGYKFRPTSSHPYFNVDNDDDDDDEVEVLTESGLTQGIHRTKAQNRNALPSTKVIEGNDEEKENLITKRESSHEYD
uniref:GOST seven transmembrane domain-containing protein n=1 Tax=Glossina brevipalpis TaxID=37001 RepID=A0A1A9X5J6_9MUSC